MTVKIIAAGLLCGGTALLAWHYTHQPGPVFQTVKVERGDLQSVVASTGTCGALVDVQVGSQVSGTVSKLYADFNSEVHKGQLLAEIDPQPFIATLNQAKASLDSAKAAVEAAKASVEKARVDIESAKRQAANQKSQMALAESAANLAKLQAQRAAQSAKADVGTVSDQIAAESSFDVSVATQVGAEAQDEAADVAVDVGQEIYRNAVNQVTVANAQVSQAEGVVQQAQLDLDHTKILSPIDGLVLARDVDRGQTVAAGFSAPTLFEIAQDMHQMQVDADIDQADISKVRSGEEATFTVDALPNVTFHAAVFQIRENPINIQNVITYDVILRVANPDLQLFPGMTANVRLLTAVRSEVLKVPSAALRFVPAGTKRERDSQFVYTLDAAGYPVRHQVQTGISDGKFVELVKSDLQEGDEVIISEVLHPKK